MNNIKVRDLFDLSDVFFADIFEGVEYAWEILPKIKEYILNNIPSAYTEYADGVFIGENVKIHSSAVIQGPAIIGSGTEIRPSAFIRGSVIIGENCVIGNSTEIKNSVLMNNVQVPHYNYVGDSILGNFAHMGAGSICSNLKADGSNVVIRADSYIETNLRKIGGILADHADVGCNCVLNPGTVIGNNTNVYPLTSVRGVIPANSIVKSMDKIVEKH